ncbi:hypothetical protein PC121_g10748 [Phytophthora cactorum]|nr:hypothetical protein PC120_g21455 [Phytophthora cactorum]KAG3066828.1 hypothetical protein PC121_g10748 [Phytophthora cactorum]KAG4045174.1 hypothetical protein PC123_g19413 [Phytophthora cactorum]
MSLFRLVLLIAATLLPGTNTASAYSYDKQPTAMTASDSNSTISKRSLRMDKVDEGPSDITNSEERALPNDILNAANHAENVISTGIKESSILKWLDKISLKLKYRYWLLKKMKPEDVKNLLGLHFVSNIESHPNYHTWLGYKKAYNKRYKIVE